jgi:hypothetical protein
MNGRAGILLGLLLSTLCACREETLFTALPADETGIAFANRITENDSINVLDFEYVYNGGGAALGDFNNDGLPDVYFTGNQVPNRLYLNRGNLKFEDITAKSGTDGQGRWSSGVALVDINADGKLDLYVGATTFRDSTRRANLLYVNQGNGPDGVPTFRELAREYGVNDMGHTTNAAFFDYDNDGDLDLYVLTNTIDQYPNNFREKIRDGSSPTTDRLYRNDFDPALGHARFTNVSRQAGITIEGYGLGINVCDLNRDGWKDLYVTNDYQTDDLLWVNNGDGTFTNRAAEYFKHTSNSAMGNDVADLNNDGLADVIALDMLPRDNGRKKRLMGPNSYQNYINNEQYGYIHQYVRNTLQLNQGPRPSPPSPKGGNQFEKAPSGGVGAPVFSEVSLLADVAETDWSWAPLVVDFDHDGYRDLIVTNGFPRDVTDRDFMAFRMESGKIADKRFQLDQIPVIRISNYAFRNRGGTDGVPTFEDVTERWGLKVPSFSNGAAYGDLDNDGDVDYVVNAINDSAFVYRNNLVEQKPEKAHYLRLKFRGEGANPMGLGAMVDVRYGDARRGDGQQQTYEHTIYRGYLSTVEAAAHFGLGDVRTVSEVKITWPDGRAQVLRNVKADQVLTVDQRNARSVPTSAPKVPEALLTDVTDSLGLKWVHEEFDFIDFNGQKLLPHKFSQYGPALAVGDVTGDGLDDAFVGGAAQKRGSLLVQRPNGTFEVRPFAADPEGEAKPWEDAGSLLVDADGDGDLDLYVVSGGNEQPAGSLAYQHRLYRNDGRGTYTRDSLALPDLRTSGSCVKAADFDRDGDLDLFVGGRVMPDRYPTPVSSFILKNERGRFVDVTKNVAPGLVNLGLVCDALWTDFDADGWPDLLLAGEWMPLTFFKNQNGTFRSQSAIRIPQSEGWWNSLAAGDFDNDGDVDYLAGNVGLNGLNRPSKERPIRIYAKDFDNNGSYDAIPTAYFPQDDGSMTEVTFHGRDDLIKQMIRVRGEFHRYADFAQATTERLLKPEDRKGVLIREAHFLQSVLLENGGNGQFTLKPLPMAAQVAPLFGMVVEDLNADGVLDVLAVGNDFGNEVSVGRYDALNGLVLLGDGRGNFRPLRPAESGLYVPGDAKAAVRLTDAQGRVRFAVTQNRGPLRIFEPKKVLPTRRVQPGDVAARLTLADGRVRREELTWGTSFYAQSTRALTVPPGVRRVELTDGKGRTRKIR